jgi:hypothetical protein
MRYRLRRGLQAPKARTTKLILEEVGDELLVYDVERAFAHCLTPQAAAVWRGCDGSLTPEQIAERLSVPAELVDQALEELASQGLLVNRRAADIDGAPNRGYTRRQATRRILASSAAVAVGAPLIMSAPAYACVSSGSPCGGANGSCCTGLICCSGGPHTGHCKPPGGC